MLPTSGFGRLVIEEGYEEECIWGIISEYKMTYANVHLRLRPMRLAHLVDPHNLSNIMSAIEINTFLGRGTFNPIVPFYKRFPSNLRDLSQDTSTYSGRALVKVDNLGSKS